MLVHWKQEMRTAFRVGLTCAAVLYIPVAIYAVCKVVYQDHQKKIAIIEGQDMAIRRISGTSLSPTVLEIFSPPSAARQKLFIVLANKTIVPAVVVVRCDGPINHLYGYLLGAKMFIGQLAYRIPGENSWMFEIDTPVWSPTNPLMVSYVYESSIAPKCSIEPQDQK